MADGSDIAGRLAAIIVGRDRLTFGNVNAALVVGGDAAGIHALDELVNELAVGVEVGEEQLVVVRADGITAEIAERINGKDLTGAVNGNSDRRDGRRLR